MKIKNRFLLLIAILASLSANFSLASNKGLKNFLLQNGLTNKHFIELQQEGIDTIEDLLEIANDNQEFNDLCFDCNIKFGYKNKLKHALTNLRNKKNNNDYDDYKDNAYKTFTVMGGRDRDDLYDKNDLTEYLLNNNKNDLINLIKKNPFVDFPININKNLVFKKSFISIIGKKYEKDLVDKVLKNRPIFSLQYIQECFKDMDNVFKKKKKECEDLDYQIMLLMKKNLNSKDKNKPKLGNNFEQEIENLRNKITKKIDDVGKFKLSMVSSLLLEKDQQLVSYIKPRRETYTNNAFKQKGNKLTTFKEFLVIRITSLLNLYYELQKECFIRDFKKYAGGWKGKYLYNSSYDKKSITMMDQQKAGLTKEIQVLLTAYWDYVTMFVVDRLDLYESFSVGIANRLNNFQDDDEMTIPVCYQKGGTGHAVYVSLRLEGGIYSIRVDNCAPPYSMKDKHPVMYATLREHKGKKYQIKYKKVAPYILSSFPKSELYNYKKYITKYITTLFKLNFSNSNLDIEKKVKTIYLTNRDNISLISNKYGCKPKPHWYYVQQVPGENDCTMASNEIGCIIRMWGKDGTSKERAYFVKSESLLTLTKLKF